MLTGLQLQTSTGCMRQIAKLSMSRQMGCYSEARELQMHSGFTAA